jgi:hypothetical protein
MHSLKSRNTELNTYMNNFLDLHYQPLKMFWWRLLLLAFLGLISIIKDYQDYNFSFEQWFTWIPVFVLLSGLLTLNFQSLCLGTMSFQYRHHDTVFVLAKRFADFDYLPLIQGLEKKLNNRKRACNRSQLMLGLIFLGVLGVLKNNIILGQVFANESMQLMASSIYIALMLGTILSTGMLSIFILTLKRQLELMELSLFWIKSASTIKYIG